MSSRFHPRQSRRGCDVAVPGLEPDPKAEACPHSSRTREGRATPLLTIIDETPTNGPSVGFVVGAPATGSAQGRTQLAPPSSSSAASALESSDRINTCSEHMVSVSTHRH